MQQTQTILPKGLAVGAGEYRAPECLNLGGNNPTINCNFPIENGKQARQEAIVQDVPVLLYHHVGPFRPAVHPLLTVSPTQFAKHIDWLARHCYTPIHTSEWIAWLTERRPLPSRPVIITFDDGYADIVEYALPTIERYEFKIVVYIVTGLIGRTNEWDRQLGWGKLGLMTEDQIVKWAARGVEFGSHSRSHVDLRSLSQNQLEDEIFGSAADLQQIIGTTPSFAYPYGYFNTEVRDCVARAFRTSYTVEEAICSDRNDPYLMPRIWVRPKERLSRFAQRVKSGRISTLREKVAIRARLRRAGLVFSKTEDYFLRGLRK